MQQRPTLAEGGTVKMKWWRFFHYAPIVPVTPELRQISEEINRTTPSREIIKVHGYWDRWDFDWTVISVDPASKKTERGSQHGILVVAGKGPQRFILDDKTRRGDILEVLDLIEKLCSKYEPDRILIEAKAAGPALMTLFEDRFQKGRIVDSKGKTLPVVVDPIEPQGDKAARLDACLPEIEAGLVHLPDMNVDGASDWVEAFVGEVCGYPAGSFDDRVDTLSQALNHMRMWGTYQLPKW
jgi:predicted phage terminase large subunit-like protein